MNKRKTQKKMNKHSEYRYKNHLEQIEISFEMEFDDENEQLRDDLANDKLNEITNGKAEDYFLDDVLEIG